MRWICGSFLQATRALITPTLKSVLPFRHLLTPYRDYLLLQTTDIHRSDSYSGRVLFPLRFLRMSVALGRRSIRESDPGAAGWTHPV